MSYPGEPIHQPAVQWLPGEEPACDEGLALLRQFAEVYPTVYEIALRKGFIDPADQTHPFVLRNPLWTLFVQHYSACEKCNEV